jgi:iron complex transport system substrate-binding protein
MVSRNAVITLGVVVAVITIAAAAYWYTSLSPEAPGEIVDDLGRNILVEERPKRIVSMAPSVTEMLFALDLGDKIVGVTDACDYPLEALEIEKIAHFQDFDVERIVELNPDLVIMDRYFDLTPPGFWLSKLEEVGVTVVVLYAKDLEDVIDDIELVGHATGSQRKATDLVNALEERINAVIEKVANITEEAKPRVFSIDWYDGESDPWTSGIGTFADDIVKLAGGINIAGVKSGFFQMDLEAIIWANPQIVLVIEDYNWPTPTYESIVSDQRLQSIEALQNNAIDEIDANLVSRPGPRLVDGLEETAKMLHPELFA